MSRIGKILILPFVFTALALAAAAPDTVTLRDGARSGAASSRSTNAVS